MKNRKNTFTTLLVLMTLSMLISVFSVIPVSAADAAVEPYMDLSFTADGIFDEKSNTELTIIGGGVKTVDFVIDDKTYQATAFRGEHDFEYIEVLLEGTKITSAEDWAKFIMSGITLELFIQVDADALTGTAALFGSCWGGGIVMYTRKDCNINMQLGSDGCADAPQHNSSNTYSYSNASTAGKETSQLFDLKKLVHIAVQYDPATNELKLFYNGELVQASGYGTSAYLQGKADWSVLGIGQNVSYLSESLGKSGAFSVLDARIYDKAISNEQIMNSYLDTFDAVKTGAALIKEAATTPEPVVTTPAPVDTTKAPEVTTEAPAVTTAAPVETDPAAPEVTTAPKAETTKAPDEKKSGCGSAVSCAVLLALLPAGFIAIKRRKH